MGTESKPAQAEPQRRVVAGDKVAKTHIFLTNQEKAFGFYL